MTKTKPPVDVGDSVEVVLASGDRARGTVLTVRGGMVEIAYRRESDRSAVAIVDDRSVLPGAQTRRAFDLAPRRRKP